MPTNRMVKPFLACWVSWHLFAVVRVLIFAIFVVHLVQLDIKKLPLSRSAGGVQISQKF